MNTKKTKTIGIRTDDHFLKILEGASKCIMHLRVRLLDQLLQEHMEYQLYNMIMLSFYLDLNSKTQNT